MDGVTWVTCPHCDWYFKPGHGQEPECRCGYVLQDYDMNKEEEEELRISESIEGI